MALYDIVGKVLGTPVYNLLGGRVREGAPLSMSVAIGSLEEMVAQAQAELFGSCTNIGECEAVCPKGIKLETIAFMNREFLAAKSRERWRTD